MNTKFLSAAVALIAGLLVAGGALAANAIKQIEARRDGDVLLLKIQLAEPLKAMPGNWSVLEPPRIVLDFPETENQTGKSQQAIAAGDLKSLNLVQTEKLTRLVLNLYRPTKFSTEMDGNVMFVRLQSQAVGAAREAAPSVFQPTVAKPARDAGAAKEAGNASVRDVVFRRGEDGQGIITLELTDGSVPIDIRRTGAGVVVELRDVGLPDRLQNRRDVNDFATPVTYVTSRAIGNLTQLEIAARGRWFHQARQTGNQLLIEVKPIPAAEANKLVQTGQEGQKVSINFFDAEAPMVLRTLAEISGKNVMIDPSLNGKRVTVALDNISYDQALEIVMTQVNAGIRIRNDVVLFGDRAVLQKRDQDVADEAARAQDTAPLVTETFRLNYLKTTDFMALVRSNIAAAQTPGGTTPAAPAAPAAPAVAGAPAVATGGGMLSSRGRISAHEASAQVFVSDTAAVIEAIREVLRVVDVPPKQVLIEARIVEASTGFSDALGVRLNLFDRSQSGAGGYGVPGAQNSLRFALGTPASFGTVDAYGTPGTPSISRATSAAGTSFSNFAGSSSLNLMLFNRQATKLLGIELRAAEADDKNRTVSAPRIVTLNRKAATINNTQQVTILTGVNAQTGLPIYQTFSAPLTLGVTPTISPDNRIGLELNIAKSTITNVTTGSLDTNTVTTNVIVENGGTVVIGGFARESEVQSQERTPFLGDLPYVGFLFKSTTRSKSRSELLVFITPRIISDNVSLQ